MELTKNLIDTRSFLIDLTRDNIINGDIDNALKCTKLLQTIDGMVEGSRRVSDEDREEVAKFMKLFDEIQCTTRTYQCIVGSMMFTNKETV